MSQLHGKDWADACDMWMSGYFTLKQISEKHGVTIAALHRRFHRNGIMKGANQELERKAISQVVQDRVKDHEELAKVITEVRELNLKGSMMLSKRTLLEIKKATDNNQALSTVDDNIKALERAAKVLNTNFNTAEKILHLDKDEDPTEELPTLEIKRMTQSDVEDLRASQEAEMNDLTGGSVEEEFDLNDLEELPE